MLLGDKFFIEFPVLIESDSSLEIGAGCESNSNYYTSGAQRSTCCCGCDKA
jgi:hypothetical protein